MDEKIIMMLFVAILAIFAILLYVDARRKDKPESSGKKEKKGTRDKGEEKVKTAEEKAKEAKEAKEAMNKLINETKKKIFPNSGRTSTVSKYAPTIYVREPGKDFYVSTKVDKRRFVIGRDEDCDIVLNDPHVSGKHAEIKMFSDKMGSFYYFHNLKPVSGTEYYNQDKEVYENLKHGEKIDLEEKEAFYICDYKIVIHTPQIERKVTEDELEVEKVEEKDTNKSNGSKARTSTKMYGKADVRKDGEEETSGGKSSVEYRKEMHEEKKTVTRTPSCRQTEKDEYEEEF